MRKMTFATMRHFLTAGLTSDLVEGFNVFHGGFHRAVLEKIHQIGKEIFPFLERGVRVNVQGNLSTRVPDNLIDTVHRSYSRVHKTRLQFIGGP
jgi:hypothetical protein